MLKSDDIPSPVWSSIYLEMHLAEGQLECFIKGDLKQRVQHLGRCKSAGWVQTLGEEPAGTGTRCGSAGASTSTAATSPSTEPGARL